MPIIDVVVETPVSTSMRARQLCGMFDVPPSEKMRAQWKAELPIESRDWNVGLIVGPSGAGKTQCARSLFGHAMDAPLEWGGAGVIDDFRSDLGIEAITGACQAVGFNTIPAWLRPYAVLSNGEKFRVDLARRILELPDPVVVDEFSSVVDRQVAQIASHAVQKMIRRNGRKFIAVTCHYDVADWLQPDWIFEPATRAFAWRSLQRRPELECDIARVDYSAWRRFAPFHYLTADLNRSARCYVLSVRGIPASFMAFLPRPISSGLDRGTAIRGVSRAVTLPDYQGMGLTFALADHMGAALKDLGIRMRHYPSHPTYVRAVDRSPKWRLVKRPGTFSPISKSKGIADPSSFGGRPNAVFEYIGPPAGDRSQSRSLWEGI